MSISCLCRCGAQLLFTEAAIGRKARCRKCQSVFTVPDNRPVDILSLAPFAADMESARPAAAPPGVSRADEELAGDDRPTFWGDLLDSLLVLADPGNIITCIVIVAINFLQGLIGHAVPLGFGPGCVLMIGAWVLVLGYLCSFYLNTILETAGGEDDLPTLRVDNIVDDLLWPLLQFAGSWLFAIAPAIVASIASWWWSLDLPQNLITGLYLIGGFLWPAIVLVVALGNGFRGLWPHLLIRTMLAAPLSYLATAGVLAVGTALSLWPSLLVTVGFGSLGPTSERVLGVTTSILAPVVSIVSMRAIGLYYRHYKNRLPFKAE
jgi:hypothetical protein